MIAELDFLGVRGRFEAPEGALAEELIRDFAGFRSAGSAASPAFTVRAATRPPGERLSAGLRWRGLRWKDRKGVRRVDYEGRGAAFFDPLLDEIDLEAENPDLLRELAYLAVLSRAGEHLDRRGFHRIHALGVARGGAGLLLVLPSGGGKSTIALELLSGAGASLLSDDSPLVGPDGRLYPFPLRPSFRAGADLSAVPDEFRRRMLRRRHGEKLLVDWDWPGLSWAQPCPPRAVVIGRPGPGAARLRPARPGAAQSALAASMVLGLGLAQCAEFLWPSRAGGWLSLASLAARRALAARRLLDSCAAYELNLGSAPAAAARLLAGLLP